MNDVRYENCKTFRKFKIGLEIKKLHNTVVIYGIKTYAFKGANL